MPSVEVGVTLNTFEAVVRGCLDKVTDWEGSNEFSSERMMRALALSLYPAQDDTDRLTLKREELVGRRCRGEI